MLNLKNSNKISKLSISLRKSQAISPNYLSPQKAPSSRWRWRWWRWVLVEGVDWRRALSLSKSMAEILTLSLSLSLNSWPKTQFSLSLNLGQKPNSLSLSLNPWPKTQLSLSLSQRKFGLSFVFVSQKSGFEFCLCVIVERLWVLSLCNCWKKLGWVLGLGSEILSM